MVSFMRVLYLPHQRCEFRFATENGSIPQVSERMECSMKNKYIHFTEEQKQMAKQTDLAAFLQTRGEQVKRSGSEYEWVGHHITLRGNQFYDHYEQRGGTAVDFVQDHYGLSYPESVQLLLGSKAAIAPISNPSNFERHRRPFALPPANKNMRRVYAYLIKQRCIDRDIIYHFAHRRLIYEDAQYHNAVFVGVDRDGNPRHAHKKSTSLNNSSFRANQGGSEAAFSFHHIGKSDVIYVFEAPIDMLSFLTLYPKDWQQGSYVALCSVADHALFMQLKNCPNLKQIVLCLDNDLAGHQATDRIATKLKEKGYTDVSVFFPELKDWNEDLKTTHKEEAFDDQDPKEIKEQETEGSSCQGLQLSY